MEGFRRMAKIGLVVVLVALLVASGFFIGYWIGSDNGSNSSKVAPDQANSEQANSVGIQPTPTSSIATATATLAPIEESALETPLPEATLPPPPLPTSEPEVTAPSQLEGEAALADEDALKILREVWALVEAEYYGELPSPQERVYSAIRGMLETLDDEYTSFSEPSIAEIRRSDASGTFEGIGALVTMNEDDLLEIVQPYKESPAARAGLLPGDLVLAVDGQSIFGFGIYDAITLIRGPEGTPVVLTIQRGEAEPFDVKIVRARLDILILESEMLEGNIGHITLFEFSAKATQRMEEEIEALLDQGATALIFDLRGNLGGFLDQAIQVSDLFLDEGLVLIERRSDGQEIEFSSTDDGLAQDIPLAVLVNGGSASASEIVAGAIQDRGRGVLIGETTFGKGSVQLVHTLSDGSELRVTVARWFTPNDRAIHGEGLVPDIEVPVSQEDVDAAQDPQLERAIEYLKTGQ